eukprot:2995208-Prymnesium_polylepis.1
MPYSALASSSMPPAHADTDGISAACSHGKRSSRGSERGSGWFCGSGGCRARDCRQARERASASVCGSQPTACHSALSAAAAGSSRVGASQ